MPPASFAHRDDLQCTISPSPIGPLGLVARREKLSRIVLKADPRRFPFQVEHTYGSPAREVPDAFGEVVRQLEEYFAGERLVFRLSLDLDQGTPFQQRVWHALLDIPYGRTLTYKDLAQAIGQPSAVRAVGGANGANPIPIIAPCHRVVASDGSIGGYGGGLTIKRALLDLETRTRSRTPRLGLSRERRRPAEDPGADA